MNNELNYNPDVLSCIASLSNDEVFTPPDLANQVLDLLPKKLWSDKNAKFLDPVSKSGIFLREIVKRLDEGLKKQMPDKTKRLNHIYSKQVYGIAITELTALISRRTLYCSKSANGKFSVATSFKNENGNIDYLKLSHKWKKGSCLYCGASKETYDKGDELELYAYPFIHNYNFKNIENMKFDVIVGNPPYQLNDGGGTGSSAVPIYNKFIEQALKLNPKYLSMIIPSRWFSGGRGLDEFRDQMINDKQIKILHDFTNSNDCFPGVPIKGGVCYFLWERGNNSKCKIYTHEKNNEVVFSERFLKEKDLEIFVRYNEALTILEKVKSKKESSFIKLVSANDPFGFDVRLEGSYKRIKPEFSKSKSKNSVFFYYNGWRKDGIGYIEKNKIKKNIDWINKCKVLIPKAWGTGEIDVDWIKPFLAENGSCCTETYLVVGPFKNKIEAENVIKYTQTKFFHFLVSLIKNTQNAMNKVYSFVPIQDFSKEWTDKILYKKYKLSKEEISFIETTVRSLN